MRWRMGCMALLALPLLLAGCSHSGQFTVASTKSMNLVLEPGAFHGKHTGRDVRHIIFFLPTGMPDMSEATREALEKGNGNLLVDANAYMTYWWIPPLYGEITYVVEGKVYDIDATRFAGDIRAEARATTDAERRDLIIEQRMESGQDGRTFRGTRQEVRTQRMPAERATERSR